MTSTTLMRIFAVSQAVMLSAWFGIMMYSIIFVQRFQLRSADPDAVEDIFQQIAHGARKMALQTIAVIAVTGTGLAVTRVLITPGPSAEWIVLMCAKLVLFLLACATFVYQSWWVWPKRIFAPPDEMPRVRREFLAAAVVIAVSLGSMIAVDVLAASV
ncbi:hypothetical protein [Antrihabitans spumae]|uniref:Copper resistance protein D domain-containing protein n=1 Tax=Antrihabitans spumae TaxID=3373370 RepID=A0ABW7K4M2_9NOCA